MPPASGFPGGDANATTKREKNREKYSPWLTIKKERTDFQDHHYVPLNILKYGSGRSNGSSKSGKLGGHTDELGDNTTVPTSPTHVSPDIDPSNFLPYVKFSPKKALIDTFQPNKVLLINGMPPWKFLAYYLVHSVRAGGYLPLLMYLLKRSPRRFFWGVALYRLARESSGAFNQAVRDATAYGEERGPIHESALNSKPR